MTSEGSAKSYRRWMDNKKKNETTRIPFFCVINRTEVVNLSVKKNNKNRLFASSHFNLSTSKEKEFVS